MEFRKTHARSNVADVIDMRNSTKTIMEAEVDQNKTFSTVTVSFYHCDSGVTNSIELVEAALYQFSPQENVISIFFSIK